LQGERPMAQDCRSLGKFILDGIPPAPRGVPQIEVTFDVDANGILTVTAKDKATGKSQSIRIEGSVGLSKEEIERMKKEAEMYAEEDKKKKELAENKNMADNLIYTAEKTLRENGDKIPEDVKKEIESKLEELKKAKEGNDLEQLKQKLQEASLAVQKIGSYIYNKENQQQNSEGGQDDSQGPKEGEYREKQ